MKTFRTYLEEGTKGKIIPLGHPNHPGADPSNPFHAKWKAAKELDDAEKIKSKIANKPLKPIETDDRKLHKALEDHLGGKFEHYDFLKHVVFKTKDGHRVSGIKAHVIHTYNKDDDMGIDSDTMEGHSIGAYKHPETKKYVVFHRPTA